MHTLIATDMTQAGANLAIDLACEFEEAIGEVILARYDRQPHCVKLVFTSTHELKGLYHALEANIPGAKLSL